MKTFVLWSLSSLLICMEVGIGVFICGSDCVAEEHGEILGAVISFWEAIASLSGSLRSMASLVEARVMLGGT